MLGSSRRFLRSPGAGRSCPPPEPVEGPLAPSSRSHAPYSSATDCRSAAVLRRGLRLLFPFTMRVAGAFPRRRGSIRPAMAYWCQRCARPYLNAPLTLKGGRPERTPRTGAPPSDQRRTRVVKRCGTLLRRSGGGSKCASRDYAKRECARSRPLSYDADGRRSMPLRSGTCRVGYGSLTACQTLPALPRALERSWRHPITPRRCTITFRSRRPTSRTRRPSADRLAR